MYHSNHIDLSSSDSFHITTLTACTTFINSAIVALKSDIVTFYRCEINRGDIWLQIKENENNARQRCGTKISKTNLKTKISPVTSSQECQVCQKFRRPKLKATLVSWSAKIQPKLNEI